MQSPVARTVHIDVPCSPMSVAGRLKACIRGATAIATMAMDHSKLAWCSTSQRMTCKARVLTVHLAATNNRCESKRWRRKWSKLSADYYNELRENLPGQGPVRRPRAKNTGINMNGVWKKWIRCCRRSGCMLQRAYTRSRFCEHIREDPVVLLKAHDVKDYKTFFGGRWITIPVLRRNQAYTSISGFLRCSMRSIRSGG